MTISKMDRPEPRWQALLALLVIGAINLSLPRWLSVLPRFVFPILILILLAPTVVAHRIGRFHLNHILGIVITTVITLDLIGSVTLLVTVLPSQRERGISLLLSGGGLWLSNVLTFALWYWRLDGGGPNRRDERGKFGSQSFLFPQMQAEMSARADFGIAAKWRPNFVDYLFVAFTQSATFGPTDAPLLARWAKGLTMLQIFISLVIVVLLISHAVGAI